MEACVSLQVFGDRFDPFANTIADNQQEEPTSPQVGCEGIIEISFIYLMARLADELEQSISGPAETPTCLSLQIR
jgi:hypothetical protein